MSHHVLEISGATRRIADVGLDPHHNVFFATILEDAGTDPKPLHYAYGLRTIEALVASIEPFCALPLTTQCALVDEQKSLSASLRSRIVHGHIPKPGALTRVNTPPGDTTPGNQNRLLEKVQRESRWLSSSTTPARKHKKRDAQRRERQLARSGAPAADSKKQKAA